MHLDIDRSEWAIFSVALRRHAHALEKHEDFGALARVRALQERLRFMEIRTWTQKQRDLDHAKANSLNRQTDVQSLIDSAILSLKTTENPTGERSET